MLTFAGAVSYSDLTNMPIPELTRLVDLANRVNRMRGS